jgi:hypothetical protein
MFIPGIDEDIEMILRAPQQTEDRLDDFFTNADHGIESEDDAPTFTKRVSERRDAQGRRWLGKSWSAPGQ